MRDIWFISDTHFFHDNILKFKDREGNLIRPGFENAYYMNNHMRDIWNANIKPQDHVWHLGDVAFKTTEKAEAVNTFLRSLHGHKRLVVGNHDNLKSPVILNNFEKIELWRGFKDEGFTCSHIPLPIDTLRDGKVNVHGHIHQNVRVGPYVNVSVERTKYRPIHMDELKEMVKNAQA
jgi:calcineurin-like phosphoesterase family protein